MFKISNLYISLSTRKKCLKFIFQIFAFDYSFWSMDSKDPRFVDQNAVFNSMGKKVLNNALTGFNACIFAYGQTGSGKSYSMMGAGNNPGIIPRIASEMFIQIEKETNENKSFKVEVSYLEIYNEKVRDLLNPSDKKTLKGSFLNFIFIERIL
jgi:hypothetical protein